MHFGRRGGYSIIEVTEKNKSSFTKETQEHRGGVRSLIIRFFPIQFDLWPVSKVKSIPGVFAFRNRDSITLRREKGLTCSLSKSFYRNLIIKDLTPL